MKGYVQDGETLTVTANRAVASGGGMLIGSIFCVATSAAANAAVVEAQTCGVIDIPAVSADTAAIWADAYWNDTTFEVTATVGSNKKIGVFAKAKLNGETTARVRLNGVSV